MMIIHVASERRREGASYAIHYSIQTRRTTQKEIERVLTVAGDFTSSVDDNQIRLFIETAQSARFLSGEKTSFRGCVVSRPLRVIHTAKVHATLCWSATEAALLVHFLVPTAPYFCDTLLDFYYLWSGRDLIQPLVSKARPTATVCSKGHVNEASQTGGRVDQTTLRKDPGRKEFYLSGLGI